MTTPQILLPMERITKTIFLVRGGKVIVDADLATLYGVPTKALNQAIKRNQDRFPEDFAFRLTPEEGLELVTNCDRFANLKHSSVPPSKEFHTREIIDPTKPSAKGNHENVEQLVAPAPMDPRIRQS